MLTMLTRRLKTLDTSLATRIAGAKIAGETSLTVTTAELATLCQCFNREETTCSQIGTATLPRWKGGKKNPVVSAITDPSQVVKFSRYNCNMGIWARQIDKRVIGDIGEDIPEYQPLPPNGKEYIGNSPVMVKIADPSVMYLSVIPMGFWSDVTYIDGKTCDTLPNLHSEEYKWEGTSRVERETGLGKSRVSLIRTPKIENIVYLAPWGRGEDGKFKPVELSFTR